MAQMRSGEENVAIDKQNVKRDESCDDDAL